MEAERLAEIVTNKQITDGAARVGAYLTVIPDATIAEIARALGISEDMASRRREELREQGWEPAMAEQHTTGPLTIKQAQDGRAVDYAIIADGHVIGEAYAVVDKHVIAPARANASLWAASPDLLEAARAVLSHEPIMLAGLAKCCVYCGAQTLIFQPAPIEHEDSCEWETLRRSVAKAEGSHA